MDTASETTWQDQLRDAFRKPSDLASHLEIPLERLPPAPESDSFPLLVPRGFADRMRKGDPSDPLLRQVWPDAAESLATPEEHPDPVGDLSSRKAPGLLQKYATRALVVTTGACAVHCRYCFRQNFPYDEAATSPARWQAQLESFRKDPTIREAIFSGGDPLMLPDSVLAARISDLEQVTHLKTLRIHTRLPVVLPSRITGRFCRILSDSRLRVALVVHANHATEIDASVADAIARLRQAGAAVLNQSVLLAGVNDSSEALESLSLALWDAGALPYYLHALDRVEGSSRFRVADDDGIRLIAELRRRLPGYLVPKFVREIEGEPSKTPVG